MRFVGNARKLDTNEQDEFQVDAALLLPETIYRGVAISEPEQRSDQEYFADGMVDDIITGLSRIRWLFVIARNSSFAYKGRGSEINQVGRELGVRYVLDGTVRKAGDRIGSASTYRGQNRRPPLG